MVSDPRRLIWIEKKLVYFSSFVYTNVFTTIILHSLSSATLYDSKQACVWELLKQIVKFQLLISFWAFWF